MVQFSSKIIFFLAAFTATSSIAVPFGYTEKRSELEPELLESRSQLNAERSLPYNEGYRRDLIFDHLVSIDSRSEEDGGDLFSREFHDDELFEREFEADLLERDVEDELEARDDVNVLEARSIFSKIKHGLKKVGHSIKNGVKKVGKGIKNVAQKVLPVAGEVASDVAPIKREMD